MTKEATIEEVLRFTEQCTGIGVLDLLTHLRRARALVLDADGVWWDGREGRTDEGAIIKTRDLRDGQGLSFLRGLGLRVLFATAEVSLMGHVVEKLNKLPSVRASGWPPVSLMTGLNQGKVEACERWLSEIDYGYENPWRGVIYVGDDRTDLEAMRACADGGGLVVVPSDAQRCAVRLAHVRLNRPGGGGAIRQLAEMVCDARGVDESTLPIA